MSYQWIVPIFIVFAALQLFEAYKKMKNKNVKKDMNYFVSIMVNLMTVVLIVPLVSFLRKYQKAVYI